MAIGERIRFFRNLKGMTQKYLGIQVGFPEKTADIRMAQYESGSRTPKADLTNNLANIFGVSTSALTVPDIDSYNGLMHTLFTLEDLYGFRIDKLDDELCIRLDKGMGTNYLKMFDMFSAWQEQAKKFKTEKSQKKNTITGDITIPKAQLSILIRRITINEIWKSNQIVSYGWNTKWSLDVRVVKLDRNCIQNTKKYGKRKRE